MLCHRTPPRTQLEDFAIFYVEPLSIEGQSVRTLFKRMTFRRFIPFKLTSTLLGCTFGAINRILAPGSLIMPPRPHLANRRQSATEYLVLCCGCIGLSFLAIVYLIFFREHKLQRIFSLTIRFMPYPCKFSPSLLRITASCLSVLKRTRARPTPKCDSGARGLQRALAQQRLEAPFSRDA
jgi:hypothetical protein